MFIKARKARLFCFFMLLTKVKKASNLAYFELQVPIGQTELTDFHLNSFN